MSWGQQGHLWPFRLNFLTLFLFFTVPDPWSSCFPLSPPRTVLHLGLCTCWERVVQVSVCLDSIVASSVTNTGFLLRCQLTSEEALDLTVWSSTCTWTFPPHTHLSTHLPYVIFLRDISYTFTLTSFLCLSLRGWSFMRVGLPFVDCCSLRTYINDWYILAAHTHLWNEWHL